MRYPGYIIFCICIFLASCARKEGRKNLAHVVVAHTPGIKGNILQLKEGDKLNELRRADTAFVPLLAKMGVLVPDQYKEEGCLNTLYYYGHFRLSGARIAAVFGYQVCNCCGDDQLILAFMDAKGNMLSAIKAAERTHPSECTITRTTSIKGDRLLIIDKEECGILEGPDEGQMSIDSTASYYNLTTVGTMEFVKKDTVIYNTQ